MPKKNIVYSGLLIFILILLGIAVKAYIHPDNNKSELANLQTKDISSVIKVDVYSEPQ